MLAQRGLQDLLPAAHGAFDHLSQGRLETSEIKLANHPQGLVGPSIEQNIERGLVVGDSHRLLTRSLTTRLERKLGIDKVALGRAVGRIGDLRDLQDLGEVGDVFGEQIREGQIQLGLIVRRLGLRTDVPDCGQPG